MKVYSILRGRAMRAYGHNEGKGLCHNDGEGHEGVWQHEGEGHEDVWHHEGDAMRVYATMRGVSQ